LALADLGFFKLERFETWNERGVFWLTRLKVRTILTHEDGQPVQLDALLKGNAPFSLPVKVGGKQTLAAYLVAAPLGEDDLKKRQAHLKETARKKQRPTSEQQLAVSHWTLYLTNIPGLSFEQTHILARTQIVALVKAMLMGKSKQIQTIIWVCFMLKPRSKIVWILNHPSINYWPWW